MRVYVLAVQDLICSQECTEGYSSVTRKDGARTALFHISLYLCCSDVIFCVVHWLIVLFYVVVVCKCVLPPGDNPIAVNKYYYYYYYSVAA